MADFKPEVKAIPVLDLDDLLTRALAKQTPVKPRRKATDTISPEEMAQAERRILQRWRDPANWERTRNVTLIHVSPAPDEQQTLLGNFVEYIHKLSTGVCRKLVRDTTPSLVGEVELVRGNNWLAERLTPQPLSHHKDATAEEEREAIADLHLPEMNHVFAPAVMVTVKLTWGGIAKIELMDETRFYGKDKQVHLLLPAGLDVLEVLSFESKQAIRRFLEI